MLIDSAIIHVRSGKGGDGHVSFLRGKYAPKGGPNGGDGGDGGSVYLLAQEGVDTLLDFAGRHHWRAEDGQTGGKKQMHGKNGDDLIIELPAGTLVFDAESGDLLADLDQLGKRVAIAPGGRGGFGNEHFKTATNQVPRESTPGEPGVELTIRLELKLIADVGLVGKPNAGKSTLLSRLSKARPKVADYPFTTLAPNLGIAELSAARRLVFADIPGLIEGAHEGQGLGHQFLRHVERTRLLLHLIEVEPIDGTDPVANYRAICRELAEYSPELAGKPQVIVLTKMDLLPTEADREAAVQMIEDELGERPLAISSATGEGITALLEVCWDRLKGQVQGRPSWSPT